MAARTTPVPRYIKKVEIEIHGSMIPHLNPIVKDGQGLTMIAAQTNYNTPQGPLVAEIYNNACGNPAGISTDTEALCSQDKMVIFMGHMVSGTSRWNFLTD
jgi:hypothetical protein